MYQLKNPKGMLTYPFRITNDSPQHLFERAIKSCPHLLGNGTIIQVPESEKPKEKPKKSRKKVVKKAETKAETKNENTGQVRETDKKDDSSKKSVNSSQ